MRQKADITYINRLFEDFIEDLEQDDIASNEVEVETNVNRPILSYPHFVEFRLIGVSVNKNGDMVPAGLNLIKKRVLPLMRSAERDISSWKCVWYSSNSPDEGAWNLDDAVEYYSYMTNNSTDRIGLGHLRFYFEPIRENSVSSALRILMTFIHILQQFKTMNGCLNLDLKEFYLDNIKDAFFNTYDGKAIINRIQDDAKSIRRIKRWVNALCPSKKVQKQFNDIMQPRDDFMGSGLSYNHIFAKFLPSQDIKKVIMSPYKDKNILVIVPKDLDVMVRSYNSEYDTPCIFRIDGHLTMKHNIHSANRYKSNDKWIIIELDPEYEHNYLTCFCSFNNGEPNYEGHTTINLFGRHIKHLEIAADDLFCDSIDTLKSQVTLLGTENVGEISWKILEFNENLA